MKSLHVVIWGENEYVSFNLTKAVVEHQTAFPKPIVTIQQAVHLIGKQLHKGEQAEMSEDEMSAFLMITASYILQTEYFKTKMWNMIDNPVLVLGSYRTKDNYGIANLGTFTSEGDDIMDAHKAFGNVSFLTLMDKHRKVIHPKSWVKNVLR
jgi:hypothetical protein